MARTATTGEAVRLALVMNRLRARIRAATAGVSAGLSVTQIALLKRICAGDPETAASLAAAEHISQQAVAQNLASLKVAGFVDTAPDPTDGRRTLLQPTEAGRDVLAGVLASRDAWLAQAIRTTLSKDERAELSRAIDLLERIAAVEP